MKIKNVSPGKRASLDTINKLREEVDAKEEKLMTAQTKLLEAASAWAQHRVDGSMDDFALKRAAIVYDKKLLSLGEALAKLKIADPPVKPKDH